MCGIVTAIATNNVVPVLLEGLRKLEYRGYDSAGLAVLSGELTRLRSPGRVADLTALADASQLSASIGIAHTRWATHGVPSERNAHPHISGGLAVVHNGIIENFEAIQSQPAGHAATCSLPRPTPKPSPTSCTTSCRAPLTSSRPCARPPMS
jgi:glucosamine--fructose-6-phosphate aminotransferase (isomerizing)